MVQGRSLQELVAELKRQENVKRDFMAITKAIEMVPVNGEEWVPSGQEREIPIAVPQLRVGNEGIFDVGEIAHGQLANYLKIPSPYYDRMLREAPGLLTDNVNTWLGRKDERRFVRVLDGRARAFLSNSYKVMDNLLVVGSALEALSHVNNLQIKSCEVTERRVYLAATTPDLEARIAGDVIHGGLRISNSEVGLGLVKVETFILVLKCSNGARGMDSYKRRHVGRRTGGDEEAYEVDYSDETLLADRKALGLKIRDTVRTALAEDKFLQTVKLLEGTTQRELPAEDVKPTVAEVTKRFDLTEKDGDGILAHLLAGGELSQWGLANAVTELANGEKNYDRGYELEGTGGKILALDDLGWRGLVKKAA